MVAKDTTVDVYNLAQLNEELNEFYKYLKENKYSDEEIRRMFQPFVAKLQISNLLKYFAAIVVFVALSLCFWMYLENISWHVSAVGRIILIELLPYWNWQLLKNHQCLVTKLDTIALHNDFRFNCDICETIDAIDTHNSLDPLVMKIRYLDMDIPVVLTDLTSEWPTASHILSNVSADTDIKSSVPCSVASNIINGDMTVGKLLRRTELFHNFFLHFQNCDLTAVKSFRLFVSRPQFLHPELAPIQFNWLLWSRDYNTSNYKKIDLIDKFAIVGQIEGINYFKLIPRINCEDICKTLFIKLVEGEVLLVTSLWNMEYKPHEIGENFAVILETH